MFSITITYGHSERNLLFKTKESFEAARAKVMAPNVAEFDRERLHLIDDYGMECIVQRASIHGAMFEDMDHTKLAHVERGLHQARLQIAADKAGMSDPGIAAAMRGRMGGPAVLAPTMPNGAFRQ